jgi:hypothetical protein
MQMDHKLKEPVRAYLLGKLAEEQKVALEERYFTDRAFFLWVQAVEVGLIDDYLKGRLSGATRELFESRYLQVPALRSRLEEVRERRQAAAPAKPAWREWALRPVLALTLVSLAGAGMWTYFRLGDRIVHPGPTQRPSEPEAITVQLWPGLTKGEANDRMAEFPLPSPARKIRFVLNLPRGSRTGPCLVEISSIENDGRWNRVFTSPPLPVSTSSGGGQEVSLVIDSGILQPVDYVMQILTPGGLETSSYVVRVTQPGRQN